MDKIDGLLVYPKKPARRHTTTKAIKENIKKNVELLKENLKLSNERFEQVFGVSKEVGIANVLDAILRDLNK